MKRMNLILLAAFAFAALPLCDSAKAGVGTMEQVISVRTFNDSDPNNTIPGLFFSTHRSNDTLSSGWPDQVPFFGWDVTVGSMADFNGDGIDDKVLNQPLPGAGWQTVVAYSGSDGDISNTNLDDIGGGTWNWFDSSAFRPVYPDVDGDGIADNGIIATTPGSTDPNSGLGALWWGAWQSDGNIGVANDAGGGSNFSGWSPFGLSANDIGLVGDINGDGVDDRILYRDDFGTFVDYSDPNGGWGDGSVDTQSPFGGVAGDRMTIGDINGDGKDDIVIYRDGLDPNGQPADFYNLFGYFTDPNGEIDSSGGPDLQGVAGTISLGDYLVLGDLGLSALDADFDQDKDVDAADFLTLQRGYGLAGQTNNNNGDANADTFVNGFDLVNWEAQYGSSVAIQGAVTAVPEPSTVGLCLLSSLGMLVCGRNRR